MLELNKIVKISKQIEGWLSENEAKFLYLTAKTSGGNIVEIGSWKGKSTVCMALGAKENKAMVYAIDHHRGLDSGGRVSTFDEFKKNIKKFGVLDFVVPMVMTSEKAAKIWGEKKMPIQFLWIDGSHKYEDVKKDFLVWEKYVADGGIIALHDTFFWPGPKAVVDEFVFNGNFTDIGFADSITYARKTKKLGAEQWIKNRLTRLVRDLILLYRWYRPERIKEFLARKLS